MKRFSILGLAVLLVASGVRGADPIKETIEFSGTLQARERVELRSRVTSTVEKIHVEPGAAVKKDELLYTLDARLQQVELAKADAELKAVEAGLKRTSQDMARTKELVQKGLAPKDDLDKILTELTVAEARFKAAQVGVDKAKLDLDFTRIRAPFDGRLDPFGQVTVGNTVAADKTVLTALSVLDPIAIDFTLDEPTLLLLQKAVGKKSIADAKLTVKVGLVREKELTRTGTLDLVDNVINPKSRLIRARVSMANPGSKLLSGQEVKLRIVLPTDQPEK